MKNRTLPAWSAARWNNTVRSITRLAARTLNDLFTHPHDRFSLLVTAASLAALLLVGVALWGWFFSWGSIPFDFADWAEVSGPRYAVLQDAVTRGVLPLHVGNTTATRGVTDRYFSIADTPFTPQILLLGFLEMGMYIFVDTVLFYLIGFVGLLLLFRKFRLSPFSFSILFLLFNFNGSITAHFAVGHSNWTGYFLFPFFILLVWNLVERQAGGWLWVLGFSLLSLVMLLQGAFHMWVWLLIFLGVLALFNWKLITPVILGGLASVLVALPRLLPPSLVLEGITQDYLGGFTTFSELVMNMIVMRDPERAIYVKSVAFPLGWWEVDFFIGLAGFAVLVIFGIWLPLRNERAKESPFVQILVPCFVLTILSVGIIYGTLIKVFPLPPFTGERVTTRLFLLPLAFLTVLAGMWLQRKLDSVSSGDRPWQIWQQVLAFALPVVILHDLVRHIQVWRVRFIDGMTNLFPKVPFDPAQHTISNHFDAQYTNLMIGGLVVAIPVLIVLIVLAVREGRGSKSPVSR